MMGPGGVGGPVASPVLPTLARPFQRDHFKKRRPLLPIGHRFPPDQGNYRPDDYLRTKLTCMSAYLANLKEIPLSL